MKALNKTLAITVLALCGFFLSPTVTATEILKVSTVENSSVILLEIDDPSESEISVLLLDQNSHVIYRDRVDAGSTFETSYDFAGTKNGTYTLISEMGNMRFNRVFSVKESDVRLVDSFYSFSPQMEIRDNRVVISSELLTYRSLS